MFGYSDKMDKSSLPKNNTPLHDIQQKLRKFAEERNWDQFHSPKTSPLRRLPLTSLLLDRHCCFVYSSISCLGIKGVDENFIHSFFRNNSFTLKRTRAGKCECGRGDDPAVVFHKRLDVIIKKSWQAVYLPFIHLSGSDPAPL